MAHSGAAPKRGCLRWFVGCLVAPVCVVLVFILVMSVRSGIREGHIVFSPEVWGSLRWSVEGPAGEVAGGWRTDDAMVYGAEGGVTSVDIGNGDERWRLEPAETVCGMSDEARDGFGVVLLEGDTEEEPEDPDDEEGARAPDPDESPALSCDTALLVDTDSGEEVWRTGPLADEDFEEPDLLFSRGSGVAQVGDQVLVRAGGELVGLDAASGEELWRRGPLNADEASCPAADFLARDASEVVIVADCGIDESITVHVADPATGEDISAFEFPRGQSSPNTDSVRQTFLVATDPIHVRVDLGHRDGAGSEGYDPDQDNGASQEPEPVLAFDDDGRLRNELDVSGSLVGTAGQERPYVVEDGRIYTSTDDSSCSNDIRAHDLDTGDLVWETAISDPGTSVIDVRDGRLLVMLDGDGSFGECHMLGRAWDWQLYTLDTATGEDSPMSGPLSSVRQPQASDLWWADDRIVQVDRAVSGRPNSLISYR
ncbi:PQQ-binding-like beta-propeller repeat protein [Nocardiopsis sp. NPDC049922]|uniref:outer membrane protein assembly factor BamB family protein n=1 Tax=Nocardiopsis sp. NPDC049922 TaxID=3155157 RepID=UPI0033E10AB9